MNNIDELLTRGVDRIYPTTEGLEKILKTGKKLKVYQGFDPTSESLHIGHMLGLRKLRHWQRLGHKVIFLIGDFTAMIGDPSGKTASRKILTHEQALKNAKTYKKQVERLLDFKGSNPVEIKYNGEWLAKMSAIDFFNLSRNLTYNQIIERDLFQERQKSGNDVYLNELLYPFMQAYDSVAMDVDVEVGGSDQTFNMLMGRKLMRNILKKEKYVMTTPLLVDSKGVKIGKTGGNVIALTDSPKDLFGKIMALSDDIIVKGFEYLTDVPISEINNIDDELKRGANPIGLKKKLSFEIVKELNDENSAKEAEENFERTVQKKEMQQTIDLFPVENFNQTIFEIVSDWGQLSNSELKRLIQQKGVEVNGIKISLKGANEKVTEGMIIQIGPRRVVKISAK